MSTEAIKKASVTAGLGTIIDGNGSADNKIRYSITADEFKTYSMQQVNDAWKAVKEGNDVELTNFVKGNKGKAYFMVSIKTAIKPSFDNGKEKQKSGGFKCSVPLAALTSGVAPVLLGDPHVGVDVSEGSTTNTKGVFDDEIAFAAEYRVVAIASEFRMSFQKLVSRKQFLEDKGVLEQSGRGRLAFGGDDSDSDVEDDDDVEKFI